MHILFCDDDNKAREEIKNFVLEYFCNNQVEHSYAEYSNPVELLHDEETADMAFLDIEMPAMNGFELARELKQINKKIIVFMVTNHNNYLDDAFRNEVFRFLSKPIDKDRLFRNLNDAMKVYYDKSVALTVNIAHREHKIDTDNVVYIEKEGRLAHIQLVDEDFYTKDSIESFEKVLQNLPIFCEIRNRCYVNMNYVTNIEYDGIRLYFNKKDKTIYGSKRKIPEIRKQFATYIGVYR